MKRSCRLLVSLVLFLISGGSTCLGQVVDFEDLTLSGPGKFNNGSDGAGGFTSGGAFFNNIFTDFGGFTAWEGWSYSNVTDVTTPGFGNQYSAFHLPGGGGDQSSQYGIAFSIAPGVATISLPVDTQPVSARITNNTYAALSMLTGDAFSKKFGGASGNDPDFFKLTITGLDALETPVGSVDFYLADYRFADNAQDFVLDEWTTVDLTSLTGASTLSFGLESTDVGDFGINTPTYFALDNLTVTTAVVPEPRSLLLVVLGGLVFAGYGAVAKARRRRKTAWVRGAEQGLRSVAVAMVSLALAGVAQAGPFSGPAGTPGSDAISKDRLRFVGWATGFQDLVRGPQDVSNPASPPASFGTGVNALGPATGSPGDVVSLGDGGSITLTFSRPLFDGPGADFAVFENGFAFGASQFLELAHVEVSTNGLDFFRFPSVSLTPLASQIAAFDPLDPTDLHNLAGKTTAGFGTPFDLSELAPSAGLNLNRIEFIRLIDVVGSIDPTFGSVDSLGNLVNDPFTTPFSSSGFDLEAVGVLHAVPEPASLLVWGLVGLTVLFSHLRKR